MGGCCAKAKRAFIHEAAMGLYCRCRLHARHVWLWFVPLLLAAASEGRLLDEDHESGRGAAESATVQHAAIAIPGRGGDADGSARGDVVAGLDELHGARCVYTGRPNAHAQLPDGSAGWGYLFPTPPAPCSASSSLANQSRATPSSSMLSTSAGGASGMMASVPSRIGAAGSQGGVAGSSSSASLVAPDVVLTLRRHVAIDAKRLHAIVDQADECVRAPSHALLRAPPTSFHPNSCPTCSPLPARTCARRLFLDVDRGIAGVARDDPEDPSNQELV